MACLLAGFAVSRGIYFDKDDKVLKIGSKRHPETLRQFNELVGLVRAVKESDGKQTALIEETRAVSSDNAKDILRLTFYQESLTVANRLVAGKRYLALGGNGETEKDVRPLRSLSADPCEGLAQDPT